MRTTITLEDDVAALVRRAMKARKASLKQVVNEALRVGLTSSASRAREAEPTYRVEPHDSGRCLIGDIVCVAEALALAEGEDHR
jgi:phage FluMu gp28-like protein